MNNKINDGGAIKQNLEIIRNRISIAAEKSGRKFEDITLICVTKTFEMDVVKEALKLGISDIAENKVQEILRKYPEVSNDIRKHMIGHLQRNKVKSLIGKVNMIQSVDSIRLIEEINRRAEENNLVTDYLIQLNIAGEEQKSGIDEKGYEEMVEYSKNLSNVRLRGLMFMAPFIDDESELRFYFKKTKKIFDSLKNLQYNNMNIDTLSMGMSGDFELAIEEGSTMVRIGSAIFGKRNYQA